MVRVSIDVPALRGVITNLNDIVDSVFDEWSAVSAAAGRGLTTAPALSALGEHTSAITQSASDLQTRLDLAILYNTGDDGLPPTDGTLTYELTGSTDSIAAVKAQLGVELAEAADTVYPEHPDAYRAYTELIERYQDDGAVTSSMYQTLGPDGALLVICQFARDGSGYIELEDQQRLLDAMKASLHSASEQPGFPAADFAEGLVDTATTDPEELARQGSPDFVGALSYLLYDSEYSDPFLEAVADGLDQFERVEMEGSENMWSNRMGTGSVFFDIFPPEAGVAHYDPTVSLMSALGNNPAVALDFFHGGGDADDDGVVDRQLYWIHDRMWSHDQFLHLSEALLAATTDTSLIDPPTGADAARAADLASVAVNMLGHRDGIGFYDAGMFGTDMERSEAASVNFATILATYMYGVDQSLQGGAAYQPAWNEGMSPDIRSGYYPGMTPNVPIFNLDSLEKFIALSAGNEEGLLTLRAGLNEFTAEKYALAAAYLQENGADDDVALDIFEQAYLSQAGLEGAFVDAIGDASVARAKGEDEVRRQWVALGQSALGMVPVGNLVKAAGGDQVAQTIIGFAVNRGVGASATELGNQWATMEAAERDRQGSNADNTMALAQYNVFAALDHAGLVPDTALQGPWAPDGDLLSWEEFRELDPEDQVTAISWLKNVEDGTGGIFNPFDFEVEFRDSFEEPFESN